MNNSNLNSDKINSSESLPDIELSKVRSFDKRQELLNILHSEEPDHYSRLYFVGFLKHVGYSQEEICDIIDKDCSWSDYDAVMTFNQVRSVFHGVRGDMDISSQVLSSQLLSSSKKEAYCSMVYVSCDKCPEKCTLQSLGRLK